MADPAATVRYVAQYLRMSTERQDHSIAHQRLAIAAYAAARGFEIIQTFVDEGISGLGVERRHGLKNLLASVISGQAAFEAVLVYDVSRWGRFQNPDQAAHYEFLCHEAGIQVVYCAEEFANDGTMTAVLMKSIKRVMAAEYSRELSAKVMQAQETLASQGYWQGGPPGYGLRRQQVRSDGTFGRLLEAGDSKGPQNGRTVLVLGPPEEVAVVQRIFDLYAKRKLGYRRIANLLNGEGIPSLNAKPWNPGTVENILKSERYVGTLVLKKEDRRLGKKSTRRQRSEWIRTENAFEAIVPRSLFDAAQRRRTRQQRRYTNEELLQELRRMFQRRGLLNREVIAADRNSPSDALYRRRFGSLLTAYELVGYRPTGKQAIGCASLANRPDAIKKHPTSHMSDEAFLAALRDILAAHGRLTMALIDATLGRWAYRAGIARFGGGLRMYALAGYEPNVRQRTTFAQSTSESISLEEAEVIRRSTISSRCEHASGGAPRTTAGVR